MSNLRKRRAATRGFSLIEALMSCVILMSVLAAVYGTISGSRGFAAVESTYGKMQMDSRKVLERITGELRMSAWIDNPVAGEPALPYVFTNGLAAGSFALESHPPATQHVGATSAAFGDVREIVFKIPIDIDGDGLLTDGKTGEIEWCPYNVSYVLVSDAGGINELQRRENGVVTDILARYVERITFDTIYTDAKASMNEIAMTIYMARPTPNGILLESSLSTCVTMRNIADAS